LDALQIKPEMTRAEAAKELHQGYLLFQGKARCALCHKGPLFTDHDFHNLGVHHQDRYGTRPAASGTESGRFAHLPAGLKDPRLVGAYRTPTLRALPRTDPYMNDGSMAALRDVLKFYNTGIAAEPNVYLDPLLLAAPRTPRRLELDEAELRAL